MSWAVLLQHRDKQTKIALKRGLKYWTNDVQADRQGVETPARGGWWKKEDEGS